MAAEPGSGAVKSAERAMALIEFVADRGAVSFPQILEGLRLPRSSAFGLVNTLVGTGWLSHDPDDRRYRLGLRSWEVGQRYTGHRDLPHLARPVMDRLCEQLGETVQLAQLDGIENIYIAISESRRPMRLASSVGMRLHAHATGIGKALLGMLEPEEARARLAAVTLPRLTEHTTTDVEDLMAIVDASRERGYAIDDEEYVSGCRCVAVPVLLTASGAPTAMSITMPTSQTGPRWPEVLVGPLQDAAAEIRHRLQLV